MNIRDGLSNKQKNQPAVVRLMAKNVKIHQRVLNVGLNFLEPSDLNASLYWRAYFFSKMKPK